MLSEIYYDNVDFINKNLEKTIDMEFESKLTIH